MTRIAALAVTAVLAAAGAARAETAFDLVFRTGTLDGLPPGTELTYEGEGLPAARPGEEWRRLVVGLGPDDGAHVEGLASAEGPAQPVGSFRAAVGNPVAMVFLERTVRTISEETGGSETYVRNRMRDALGGPGEVREVSVAWGGAEVPATEVVLHPFAGDARGAELGVFADLEIRVVVSAAVPGWYHSISAEAPAGAAPGAFASSLTLAGGEG